MQISEKNEIKVILTEALNSIYFCGELHADVTWDYAVHFLKYITDIHRRTWAGSYLTWETAWVSLLSLSPSHCSVTQYLEKRQTQSNPLLPSSA